MFNDLNYYELVYWDRKQKNEPVENSMILSRKDGLFIKEYYDKINTILNSKKDIKWTEIGGEIFRNMLNDLDGNVNRQRIKMYDQDDTCYPVHWSNSNLFFEKGKSDFLLRENQPVIMLYNHIFPKGFKDMNDSQFGNWLKTSDTILADLIRTNYKNEWDFLEKAVFINLESRTDRLAEIQNELIVIPKEKVLRFNAILDSPGHIGCSKSHIECIKMAMHNNWRNILVIEDDAMWNKYNRGYNRLLYLMRKNPNFDVITFGNTDAKFDKNTGRLYSGATTTAYLVNQHYYQTLLQNFEEGVEKLHITKTIENLKDRLPYEKKYCIDQYWKHLQAKDNWFIVNPALMIQRPGKSSIIDANHGEDVDYTSLFNL